MNLVRATHQVAMEMSVLARYSLAKGHRDNANDYYTQAFQWERKAAFMTTSLKAENLIILAHQKLGHTVLLAIGVIDN